jgi:hypothetical protein
MLRFVELALQTLEVAEASGFPARPAAERWPELGVAWEVPEPLGYAELREIIAAGDELTDSFERLVAQMARAGGALDVALGEGLAALTAGDRLISLGFSCLTDYAREVLGVKERKAQDLAHLARELRSRPLLRAAVRAGELRCRAAQTVLPVARGDSEAAWVERARTETVRGLEAAVREARAGLGELDEPGDEADDWTRLRVALSSNERAVLDEALSVAGKVLPGSSRAQRLEAMAQEYLGEHPTEAGDDGGQAIGGMFRPIRAADERTERLRARLEAETERWSYLLRIRDVAAPDAGFDEATSAREIDARLRELSAMRDSWDGVLGFGAYSVKRSGLWRILGFASFDHYCEERLGLAKRTVETRAALEKRLWEVPALRAARDSGLSYEKLRLLSYLPGDEVEAWLPRARALTVVALRRELEARDDAQMRAARILRTRVPTRVALLLAAAFRAVREVEGCLLCDGRCLVIVARHFLETWKPLVKKPRTRSQKVRERDLGDCQVPGCSRRAAHAHHVTPRSHGGGDEDENLAAVCACHHLRGIHGGYVRVRGQAPHRLVWELGGRVWTGSFRAGGA